MGCCSSLTSEEKELLRRSKVLQKQQELDKQKDDSYKKLLLLGAGESGKSTLFKQMITIYGSGYSQEDLMSFRTVVHQNAIDCVRTLVAASTRLGITIYAQSEARAIESNRLLAYADDIPPELKHAMQALWADAGIQQTYDRRAEYQLMDSCKYLLTDLDRICLDDYIPTFADVLRTRVRTTGIVETEFTISKSVFKMFDVGGQRNERKKWIHCFEEVTAIVFVAAISEYDQVLFEDATTNRMHEALDLFGEISNSRWFRNTSIILFLNKRDLLEEKILKVPLTVCFEDYEGPQTYQAACDFFDEVFREEYEGDQEIYAHITCATDTDNIKHVFNAAKDIIIRASLKGMGVMRG